MSEDKKKKIQKPLNPLGAKPGQNYGTPKFKPSKEYDKGEITFKEEEDKSKK